VTRDKILTMLSDENPEALLADGFEDAFVGFACRCGQPTLAVYDYDKGVELLMENGYESESEAQEWMFNNVAGAWMGEHTPMWLFRVRKEDE
jgi:hypothetical protein